MVKLSIIAASVLVKCNPCVYTMQSLNIATNLDRFASKVHNGINSY